MNFRLATKPLNDSLSLGIINGNINNYYKRSCIAQVCAYKDKLVINLEASRIVTEIVLKGSGDSDEPVTTFVSCLLLKQLVSTFTSAVTELEFLDGGLVLHSGNSKFSLPKLDIDASTTSLNKPSKDNINGNVNTIDKADWKFVKDNQMYAIAMSFAHPVYTRVWVGKNGDVLVSDFDNGLFTHSEKSKLNKTCLLSDTIINLFNAVPEETKIAEVEDKYIIDINNDSYSLRSEFIPELETDEGIGSYNSDIIIETMLHNEATAISIPTAEISKFLSQADILSTGSEASIIFNVQSDKLTLKDDNTDCKIILQSPAKYEFEAEFKTSLLKSMLASYSGDKLYICPTMQGQEVTGICVWDDQLTTVLASL